MEVRTEGSGLIDGLVLDGEDLTKLILGFGNVKFEGIKKVYLSL
jgi:hypothetical protein